jgi:hypothetical protein
VLTLSCQGGLDGASQGDHDCSITARYPAAMSDPPFKHEQVATDLLDHSGLAVIWQLHLSAARLYRTGNKPAAWLTVEIADAAERVWVRRSGGNQTGSPPRRRGGMSTKQ